MANTEQRQKLHDYLMRKYSPEFQASQGASDNLDAEGAAKNALAASLMKSAAQVGTIGGKQTDTSPVTDMAQNLNSAMETYRSRTDKREADREKLYSYLADKEQKAAETEADDLRASARLKQDRELSDRERKWKESRAAVEDAQKSREFQLKEKELATKNSEVKPASEAQLQSANFGRKAEDSDKIIAKIEASGYDPSSYLRALRDNKTPLIGNVISSVAMNDDDRKYMQAQKEFIAAILRKESGGAITPDEFSEYGGIYFPQPGDGKDVIAQKAASRKAAAANLIASAGTTAAGQIKNRPEIPMPPGKQSSSGTAYAGEAANELRDDMTEAELKAWIEANK